MMKSQKGYGLVLKTPSRHAVATVMGRAWHLFTGQLARWRKLHRERVQLASLSDDALKDLGLSRADVFEESERPFWDDPMKH